MTAVTTPTLETERLVLRPVRQADAPAIQKYFNTWLIIRYLAVGVPWPYPDDGAETFIQERALPNIKAGNCMIWALTLRQGGDELIGTLEWRIHAKDNRGFWLGVPFHGNGYMTEAVIAMQDYVFFERGIEKLTVMNAVDNIGSRRVKEKTGAKLVDVIDMAYCHGGTATERWEVTSKDWAKLRGL